ncbi:hypothetical protein FPOAC1_010967 [Fusarium poae]|uniref:hypothetical protein n=1 Tax=Fusarium poae TaxID=36050 RepID=UPI001CEABA39|nr:hypothetical protein FPOAC1_010967 [Fusarium poae]KAG8666164.1 hypothetical protein FPOAC1_010967 [Fusarium poae]
MSRSPPECLVLSCGGLKRAALCTSLDPGLRLQYPSSKFLAVGSIDPPSDEPCPLRSNAIDTLTQSSNASYILVPYTPSSTCSLLMFLTFLTLSSIKLVESRFVTID